MADVKISALPAATTPLAGTELVPIVQSGTTSRVSVADMTAGRSVAASSLDVQANSASAAVTITQTGAGNALVVEDSTRPDATPFTISQNGQVVIGNTASPFGTSLLSLFESNNTTTAPFEDFLKTRAGAIVQNNDGLGTFRYWGFDGANNRQAANLQVFVDGTPVTGTSMPARFSFATTPNGSIAPSERLRISSAGLVSLINASFARRAPVTKTADFTLGDNENWLICNGAGTITVTFPAASSWIGREVMIKTIAAQTVVSASSNVVPINSATAGTAILPASAGAWATLVSNGTNWVIMQS